MSTAAPLANPICTPNVPLPTPEQLPNDLDTLKRMLIEVAKGNGDCRLIFASSCSVYGATDLLMDEY